MAKAIAKYIRMSPRKLRRVIDVIRGKDASDARDVLKFMSYAAARVVEKVLKSAVYNAKENENLNPDELKVTKAYVDQSNTLRRWRAVSRGRGYPILKRTSHVTIEVNSDPRLASTHKKTKPGSEVRGKQPKASTVHPHDHEHDHEHAHESKGKSKGKTETPPLKEEKTTKIKEKAKDIAKDTKKKKEDESGGKK